MPLLFGWYGPEGQVCYVVEAALVADIDSGIVLAGFAGFVLCFPSLSSGPGCAASCAVGPEGQFHCEILASRLSPWYLACLAGGKQKLDILEMTSMSFCIQRNVWFDSGFMLIR